MKPFLERFADELLNKYGENISRICVIFPSRRAGIYFKKYLSMKIDTPIWAPAVSAIQDFISKYSSYPVSDKLSLVFELFEVFKKHGPEESFDKFYPWGEMLLNDFDEIDKNLVNADHLFRILHEYKKVEGEFEFKVSDSEEFEKFWKSFSKRDLTDLQKEFIDMWEIIGRVYHDFKKNLRAKKISYEGMAYREIYEMARTKNLKTPYIKIIFAGFNSLNKAEEGIIDELVKQGTCETYWDTDEYYMENKIQEAGASLRKNAEKFNSGKLKWQENLLKTDSKKIKFIGAPLPVSQAKALGNELKNLVPDNAGKTAVVLPDENLLVPVLRSIPDSVESLNITMGFPVKNSSLYNLVQLLKNLQKNKKGEDSNSVYYHKDVVQILLHPYIKFLGTYEIYKLVNDIKKRNIIYVSSNRITGYFSEVPELISEIFTGVETAEKSLEYLYKIVLLISRKLDIMGAGRKFELEYLYKFYTELNHLSDIFSKYSTKIEIVTFWKLLVEVLDSLRIPFTGEPLRGIQFMGLLETRLLDFETVFILSMNEGIMPKGYTQSSFIPYNLRRAFRLPTYEDEDSNYAYNFYRLIQRAKNIFLIYNTEPGELSGGEKSRFIMQIENELARENHNITLEDLVLQTDIEIPKRKEIIIDKTAGIIETLKKQEYLSATGLTSYINCPLQFYLRTVARLREEESVEEFFTGAGFGNLLHQIMELVYSGNENKVVDKAAIKALKSQLDKNYDNLWQEACNLIPEFKELDQALLGKNLLYKNVIKKLVYKILENDLKESPFKIIALEKKMSRDITINSDGEEINIKLYGRLDRIEEKNGEMRIIDYKTGIVYDKTDSKLGLENFNLIFEDPAYKERFQQYFYGYLYLGENPGTKIKTGIYRLRDLSKGIKFFGEESIPEGTQGLFEMQLKELLGRIFDPETPF